MSKAKNAGGGRQKFIKVTKLDDVSNILNSPMVPEIFTKYHLSNWLFIYSLNLHSTRMGYKSQHL